MYIMENDDGVVMSTTASGPNVTVAGSSDTLSGGVIVIIRTAVLIVLLILSLVGNALIVVAVALASKTRFNPFNAFLLSMAIYGLLECALNLSLAIGFSVEQKWMFGSTVCGFNALFIQLQNVGVILTIAAMAIDRYLAVNHVNQYHTHSSVHYANYAVLFTWIVSLLVALPALFMNEDLGVKARDFVERCLCGFQEGTTPAYTIVMVALCVTIPSLLIMVLLFAVMVLVAKEKQRVKSMNTTDYAAYSMQDSVLLKEGLCARYVATLFIMYLIFKAPYVIIDVLTQLNVSVAYVPQLAFNATDMAVIAAGSQFYYQTGFSWLMFCFSSIFPIITFLYFHDHWRRLKKWLTCGAATVSIANSGRALGPTNPRQMRQKQRRQRQQRMANGNTKTRAKRNLRKNGSAVKGHKKTASTVSSHITSEKVAVNGHTKEGEVLFRVPVLYAATDGLHLVASEKALAHNKPSSAKRWKNSSGECSSSSNGSSKLSGAELLAAAQAATNFSPDLKEAIVISGEQRPSSVVDQRVDVTGSRDCLNIDEDVVYMNSDFDIDEDTESELNESANSRTLIWPHRGATATAARSQSAGNILCRSAPTSAWNVTEDAPSAMKKINSLSSNARRGSDLFSNDRDSPRDDFEDDASVPHPHTPTPPPDEEPPVIAKSPTIDTKDSDSDDAIVDKSKSGRVGLPTFRGKNVASFVKQTRPLSQGSSGARASLLEELTDFGESGMSNGGYESSSSSIRSKANVSLNSSGHGNKVHPKEKRVQTLFNTKALDQAIDSQSTETTSDGSLAWCNDAPPNADEKLDARGLKSKRKKRAATAMPKLSRDLPLPTGVADG